MNKDITEIKEEGKETHSLVRQLGEEVRKLFFIGTVVAAIASFLLVGLKVYDTWNGIQDRERSTYTQGSEP